MASENYSILWADDEIDLLKPHLLFLRNRGYAVTTANNGRDALSMVESTPFDLVILDENMPDSPAWKRSDASSRCVPRCR